MEMRLVNEPKPIGPVAEALLKPVTLSQPVLQTTPEVEFSESSESYIVEPRTSLVVASSSDTAEETEPKEPKALANIESGSELKLKSRRKSRGKKPKGRKSNSSSLVKQRDQERVRITRQSIKEREAAQNKEDREKFWHFRDSAIPGQTEDDNTHYTKERYPTVDQAVSAFHEEYTNPDGSFDIEQLRKERKIKTKPQKDKEAETALILAEIKRRFI